MCMGIAIQPPQPRWPLLKPRPITLRVVAQDDSDHINALPTTPLTLRCKSAELLKQAPKSSDLATLGARVGPAQHGVVTKFWKLKI
jgi:hypothetical protein